MISSAIRLSSATLVSCFFLVSCANTGPLNLTGASADPNDKCGVYAADLENADTLYSRAAIEGGVAGAVGGALLGGLLSGWDTTAIAAGAGAGAVIGAGANYWLATNKASQNIQAAHTQINGDMAKSSKDIDNATASLIRLKRCRADEAKAIKARHKASLISKEQAKEEITEVKSKLKEEVKVARSLEENFAKEQEKYKDALKESIKSDPNEAVRAKHTEIDTITQQIQEDAEQQGDEPAGIIYYALREVNVRDEANLTGNIVGKLKARQQVCGEPEPTEFKDWTYITMRDGQEGYVSSRFISESEEVKKYQKIVTRSLKGSPASETAQTYIETTHKKESYSRTIDAVERDINDLSF